MCMRCVSTTPDVFSKNINVCVSTAIIVVLMNVKSIPMSLYLLCFLLS